MALRVLSRFAIISQEREADALLQLHVRLAVFMLLFFFCSRCRLRWSVYYECGISWPGVLVFKLECVINNIMMITIVRLGPRVKKS